MNVKLRAIRALKRRQQMAPGTPMWRALQGAVDRYNVNEHVNEHVNDNEAPTVRWRAFQGAVDR